MKRANTMPTITVELTIKVKPNSLLPMQKYQMDSSHHRCQIFTSQRTWFFPSNASRSPYLSPTLPLRQAFRWLRILSTARLPQPPEYPMRIVIMLPGYLGQWLVGIINTGSALQPTHRHETQLVLWTAMPSGRVRASHHSSAKQSCWYAWDVDCHTNPWDDTVLSFLLVSDAQTDHGRAVLVFSCFCLSWLVFDVPFQFPCHCFNSVNLQIQLSFRLDKQPGESHLAFCWQILMIRVLTKFPSGQNNCWWHTLQGCLHRQHVCKVQFQCSPRMFSLWCN